MICPYFSRFPGNAGRIFEPVLLDLGKTKRSEARFSENGDGAVHGHRKRGPDQFDGQLHQDNGQDLAKWANLGQPKMDNFQSFLKVIVWPPNWFQMFSKWKTKSPPFLLMEPVHRWLPHLWCHGSGRPTPSLGRCLTIFHPINWWMPPPVPAMMKPLKVKANQCGSTRESGPSERPDSFRLAPLYNDMEPSVEKTLKPFLKQIMHTRR